MVASLHAAMAKELVESSAVPVAVSVLASIAEAERALRGRSNVTAAYKDKRGE